VYIGNGGRFIGFDGSSFFTGGWRVLEKFTIGEVLISFHLLRVAVFLVLLEI